MILEVYHPFLSLRKGELRKFGILLKKEKQLGVYSLIIPDEMLDLFKYTNGQKAYYISYNNHPIGCIFNHHIFFLCKFRKIDG